MEKQRSGRGWLHWVILIFLFILLEIFKRFPEQVESWYARGVYPKIGYALRSALGIIPVSIGDLLVGVLISLLLWRIVKFLIKKKKGKWLGLVSLGSGGKILYFGLGIYIAFLLFWGLNYYRLGSRHLLGIEPDTYTSADVDTLMQHIQLKLENASSDSIAVENSKSSDRLILANEAKRAYDAAARQYSFMHFEAISFKPILLGKLQAYAGYAGYIFPFTGEAHADFYVPNFTLPFTVCHEMAHQLGFGPESEANLIGFLAAKESENPAFKYSAYVGVHQYALLELYKMDSLKARPFIEKIPPILKKDRKEQMKFQEDHSSFLQPALDAAYTFYLQGNNQPMGLQSYNRVVAWLVAYGKKYGWHRI